jgi:hypothetical protein
MRILILSMLLIICAQGLFASSTRMQPYGNSVHHPAKKVFYSKGKGVFGLITGLTLPAMLNMITIGGLLL